MYVTRIESTVIPGKVQELEAFVARIAEMAARAPGFVRGGLANSLGYPSRYTRLSLWENREAAEAFRRTDALQRFLLANPPGSVSTITRPVEAYDIISRVQDRDIQEARHVSLLDITIDPLKAQEFEQRSKELVDLRAKFGHGLVSNSVAQFLGGGGRYLVYFVHTDRDAALATANAPEVRAFIQQHPLSDLGGAITGWDNAAVVQVHTPATVTAGT
jgi:quinol monooxygenase YgiN